MIKGHRGIEWMAKYARRPNEGDIKEAVELIGWSQEML
jgi:hypothetical protein